MFRYHNLPKLATKEDPLHIHKILGIICLINYGYRYYLLFTGGTMDLDNQTAIILLGCHAALSTSSLVFHIPSVRNPKAPMIYPEYRLHSIIFVWRSVVCFLLTYYGADTAYRFATCIATMVLADTITSQFSTTNKTTTMRNMPFDNRVDKELQLRITRMQSAQQIGATLYMFGNLDACFSPMFAIQFAAFLMTMVRKNIINSTAWHTLYNMSLWINVFCFWSLPLEYVAIQPFLNYGLYYWRFSFDRRTLSVETSSVKESFNPYAHSPSKPPPSKNHSIPTLILRSDPVHSSLRPCPYRILGNKYLGLTLAYLVFRSGVGEKMAGFIGPTEMVVRNAIIFAYFSAQISNLR